VACVHDEIVLEVTESRANQFKEILEKSMTLAAETILKVVPAKADASIADTWAEK
jgi:twinkle protein